MELIELLTKAVEQGGSDIYFVPGAPPTAKRGSQMIPLDAQRLMPSTCEELIQKVYELAGERSMNALTGAGDDDFSFSLRDRGRFRVSTYRQRGTLAAVLRVVPFGLPDPVERNVPESVLKLVNCKHGLILVTGATGSGKSTTLACMIDRINQTRNGHIITLEDPIEYLHPHKRSIVSQREVAQDMESYGQALRASLRQAPDAILLGEMRDYETIQTALTAAETGTLVLSTLHTMGAATTVDRIIDVFPANRQQQVRIQLSMALKAVVSQQLLPDVRGGQVPAFEIMTVTPAIQTMIREGKTHQIDNAIHAGAAQGMTGMDADIVRLYNEKKISKDTAIAYAPAKDALAAKLH